MTAINVTVQPPGISVDLSDTTVVLQNARRSLSFEGPIAGDDVYVLFAPVGFTVGSVEVVLRGSGSPSLTFNLATGPDRSAAGSDLFTSDQVTTNTTTGDGLTPDNPTIAQGDHLRLTITAATDVDEVGLAIVPA